MQVAIKSLTQ